MRLQYTLCCCILLAALQAPSAQHPSSLSTAATAAVHLQGQAGMQTLQFRAPAA